MKRFFWILLIGITSCKIHVTNMVDIASKNPQSLMKQDTLSIRYDFWDNKGKIKFTISNNSSKPIYIDWKKSILFINNTSFTYWENESYVSNFSIYNNNLTIGNSKITKVERVMFLAPNTEYTFEKVGIYWWTGFNKTYEVYDYTYETTPLKIRNYLTISDKESFETEYYIDNYFWSPKITTMKALDYCGKMNENLDCEFPFKNPYSYFYDFKVKKKGK